MKEFKKRYGRAPWFLRPIAVVYAKLFGWKVVGFENMPPDPKMIGILVPHTSNWDVWMMYIMEYNMGFQANWLVKDSVFKWYLGWFFHLLGGIPVDRSKSNNFVDAVANMLDQQESMYLAIAPEGTREKGPRWRTGFYWIAMKARVKIILMFIDYKKKEVGFGPVITPSGDIHADFELMKAFYAGVTPKYPENRNDMVISEE